MFAVQRRGADFRGVLGAGVGRAVPVPGAVLFASVGDFELKSLQQRCDVFQLFLGIGRNLNGLAGALDAGEIVDPRRIFFDEAVHAAHRDERVGTLFRVFVRVEAKLFEITAEVRLIFDIRLDVHQRVALLGIGRAGDADPQRRSLLAVLEVFFLVEGPARVGLVIQREIGRLDLFDFGPGRAAHTGGQSRRRHNTHNFSRRNVLHRHAPFANALSPPRGDEKRLSLSSPRRMPAHVFEADISILAAWKKASPVRVKL